MSQYTYECRGGCGYQEPDCRCAERDLAALTNRHEALRAAVAKLAEEMENSCWKETNRFAKELERILQANP